MQTVLVQAYTGPRTRNSVCYMGTIALSMQALLSVSPLQR